MWSVWVCLGVGDAPSLGTLPILPHSRSLLPPTLAIATILNPRLHLSFQFFIVLLIILLAELILLILFFVYMDKVNLAERGEMEGHTAPGLGQGNHWLRET